MLKSDRPIPDGTEYVGIRAHYLSFCDDASCDNAMVCECVKAIEEPFAVFAVFRKAGLEQYTEQSEISFAMDPAVWAENSSETVILRLPKESLLFLRE